MKDLAGRTKATIAEARSFLLSLLRRRMRGQRVRSRYRGWMAHRRKYRPLLGAKPKSNPRRRALRIFKRGIVLCWMLPVKIVTTIYAGVAWVCIRVFDWPLVVRFVVGLLGGVLVASTMLLCLVIYGLWLLGHQETARTLARPMRAILTQSPSWPMAAMIGLAVLLALFFRPIDKFIARMRKGPLGTEVEPEPEQTKRKSEAVENPPKQGATQADDP